MVSNDPGNLGVSWLVTCGSPIAADCGSISRHTASGEPATYIAPTSVPPGGTVTIQANASALPAAGVTATITITPEVYGPISVAFNPAPPATVSVGAVVALSVVVTNDHIGSNGKPMGATVSVTCQVPGTCGSIILDSYYVAPSVIPAGNTVTITATSVADPTQSASATVTIVPPVVTIALVTTPPATIPAGSATNLSAFVNDGTAANGAGQMGVDWTVSCGGSACGSFIPPHTANDTGRSTQQFTTSFTAPSTVPPGGTVTITATATASPTTQVSVTLTITPVTLNDGLLNGQYAFYLSGVQTTSLTALAGSLIADGNGNITAAEESVPAQSTALTGISGSYYLGSDGRGLMTLNGLPNSTQGWLNGQQIFSLAVVDSTHVFMEEFDGTDAFNVTNSPITVPPFGDTVRGELDLQQPADFAVPPTGPFAFAWTHASRGSLPYAGYYGGVLNADPSGNVISFAIDRYVDGATTSITSGLCGAQSFSTVDSFGYGTVSIGPYCLNYFLVDSAHLIMVGSSSSDGTGLPSGHAYSQPVTMPPLAGTYVFTLSGSTPFLSAGGTLDGSTPQALGGWVTSDANGNLNGNLDTNKNGAVLSGPVSGSLAASAVPGRWLMTLEGGGASSFALYPTSSGLLIFQLDFGKSGTGTVALQSNSAPTISGNYAVSLQQPGGFNASRPATLGLEVAAWADISGQIIASNSSTLSGTADIDQIDGVFQGPSGNVWTQTPDQSVTGSFSAGPQGRFTGTIVINQLVTIPGQLGTLNLIFYVIDSSHVMLLEDDSTPAVGLLQSQNF